MIKAITIGYPNANDKDVHDVLYSGNDKGAARSIAEASSQYAVVEVIYPVAYFKRIVNAVASPVAPVIEVEADTDDDEQSEPRRRGRPRKFD